MFEVKFAITEQKQHWRKLFWSGTATAEGEVRSADQSARSGENFFTFVFQLSGWALVAPLCFALHCNCFLLSVSSVTVDGKGDLMIMRALQG